MAWLKPPNYSSWSDKNANPLRLCRSDCRGKRLRHGRTHLLVSVLQCTAVLHWLLKLWKYFNWTTFTNLNSKFRFNSINQEFHTLHKQIPTHRWLTWSTSSYFKSKLSSRVWRFSLLAFNWWHCQGISNGILLVSCNQIEFEQPYILHVATLCSIVACSCFYVFVAFAKQDRECIVVGDTSYFQTMCSFVAFPFVDSTYFVLSRCMCACGMPQQRCCEVFVVQIFVQCQSIAIT